MFFLQNTVLFDADISSMYESTTHRTEASWWHGTLVLRSQTCYLKYLKYLRSDRMSTKSLFVSVSPPGFGRIIDELSLEVATLTFLRLSLTEMRITLHRSLRDWKDHVVSMCADICLVHGVPVYKLSQLHCSTVWQKRHSRLEVCNPLCVFIFLGYTRGSVNIFFGILF